MLSNLVQVQTVLYIHYKATYYLPLLHIIACFPALRYFFWHCAEHNTLLPIYIRSYFLPHLLLSTFLSCFYYSRLTATTLLRFCAGHSNIVFTSAVTITIILLIACEPAFHPLVSISNPQKKLPVTAAGQHHHYHASTALLTSIPACPRPLSIGCVFFTS